MLLVFATLEVMIDSQCLKSEAQPLQKKNRRSKKMRWIQHDRTAWNWECFVFCDFVGKVAEIQETLGNLKNKAQGAVPDRWSERWSDSCGERWRDRWYRSALLLFPRRRWKESSEKTCSFRIVSVRFTAERKNWLG